MFTMILPRLEVFFLEEWIEHHLMLGVDKIYIYNNGLVPQPTKSRFGKPEWEPRKITKADDGKWRKKPDADHFFDYTDEEIIEKLDCISKKFSDSVSIRSWIQKVDHELEFPFSQATGYKTCAEENESDWWIHIDPDEYLFSNKYNSIREFILICVKKKQYSLRFGQRVFDFRSRDRDVREVFEWGYDTTVPPKSIVKTPIKWVDTSSPGSTIHMTLSQKKGILDVLPTDFRVNHYRGPPIFSGGVGKGHKRNENKTFDKIDKGMKRFL